MVKVSPLALIEDRIGTEARAGEEACMLAKTDSIAGGEASTQDNSSSMTHSARRC